MGCPNAAGLAVAVNVVVLLTSFTVWDRTGEVLEPKLAVPLYTAVIEWMPPWRPDVVKVVVPAAFSVPVPT
jgi:hypothetical protein